ncbi:MAG: hypothetical protein EZS28_055106, partial [Streblomastix strix]
MEGEEEVECYEGEGEKELEDTMDEGYVLSYSSSNSGALNGVGERCSFSGSTIVVDS